MSEIPEDIMKVADEVNLQCYEKPYAQISRPVAIGKAILAERTRCISIVKAIDPHNEAEAHLIETIVRRMRGSE